MNDPNNLIGKSIKYYDYLDSERFGKILAIEPSRNPEILYIYIEDDDPEFNVHQDFINGQVLRYAEIRPSSEVYFDD